MPFSQQDIEDSDRRRRREETISPSPKSSDTASSGTGSPVVRPKSQRRNLNRVKTRSRSSTGTSLVPPPLFRRPVVKQESHSSLRTVLAGDQSHDVNADSLHSRQPSQAIPPGILLSPDVPRQPKDASIHHPNVLSYRLRSYHTFPSFGYIRELAMIDGDNCCRSKRRSQPICCRTNQEAGMHARQGDLPF